MNTKAEEIGTVAGVTYLRGAGRQRPFPELKEEAIAARLADMGSSGIKTSRMAVESGVARDGLEQWMAGNRDSDITAALSKWLEGIDSDIAAREGDFVMTPTAVRILSAIEQARAPKNKEGSRGIAMIYGASGAGKTSTAKWIARTDRTSIYVQVDGECRTYIALLKKIIETNFSSGGFAHTGEKVTEFLVRNVRQGGLLIFDHAHLIQRRVMEQLTVFPDEHGIALAFIGNAAGYKSLVDAKLAQLFARVAGSRVFLEIPSDEDIDALLESWDIAGKAERNFCLMIGRQDGGLHYLEATVREARRLAAANAVQKIDLPLLKLGAGAAGCWGDGL